MFATFTKWDSVKINYSSLRLFAFFILYNIDHMAMAASNSILVVVVHDLSNPQLIIMVRHLLAALLTKSLIISHQQTCHCYTVVN